MKTDIHTHTLASGHGTADTIADMARAAAAKGLSLLGIADHGPATPGSASASYFRSLAGAPSHRFGVRILYGAEVNILDGGGLDLPDDILTRLDFVIASMHAPPRRFDPSRDSTPDYLRAMENPYVCVLGHPDSTQFPADYDRLTDAAAARGVILEVNESSLMPGGYHHLPGTDITANYRRLIALCREKRIPMLLSSDAHGTERIGSTETAERLIREADFPEALIVNEHPELLLARRGAGLGF